MSYIGAWRLILTLRYNNMRPLLAPPFPMTGYTLLDPKVKNRCAGSCWAAVEEDS